MTLLRLFRQCAAGAIIGVALIARADLVDDLAKIHVEAIGGKARIDALAALRATGQVYAGGKAVRFTMTAARPAKIRLEIEKDGRTLVQASDGSEPAWELDSGATPPKYRPMSDAVAKTFVADAEFDDPLVAGGARGYVFDFAGELMIEGRKFLRVLVTHKMIESFSLLIDDDTYFISKRIEQRMTAGGRTMQIVTHYEDFRPIDGVLLPHKITVAVDGNPTQQTRIAKIVSNPLLSGDLFSRPTVAVPGLEKP